VYFDEQILKTTTLVAFDQGVLVMTNIDAPYLVVAADEIIVDNPNVRSVLWLSLGTTSWVIPG
jgi:hypothetical protein